MGPKDEWKAQMDASTLAEAEAIKQDPRRLNAASNAADSMVKEQTARLNGLKKVANGPAPSPKPSSVGKKPGFWRQ